jgi:hypothetical protein
MHCSKTMRHSTPTGTEIKKWEFRTRWWLSHKLAVPRTIAGQLNLSSRNIFLLVSRKSSSTGLGKVTNESSLLTSELLLQNSLRIKNWGGQRTDAVGRP